MRRHRCINYFFPTEADGKGPGAAPGATQTAVVPSVNSKHELETPMKEMRKILLVAFLAVMMRDGCISLGESYPDPEVQDRFRRLQEQYQAIETVHLQSRYTRNVYGPSDSQHPVEIRHMTSEYWANSRGQYRGHTRVESADDFSGLEVQYADNGDLWQYLRKDSSTFSYGKKRFAQNPDALENPLLSPVAFLSREDDNCRACAFNLADVLSEEAWTAKVSQARRVTVPQQEDGQLVVELPGSTLIGKSFVYQVYFGKSPNYLPTRIAWVSQGEVFKSIDLTYQPVTSAAGQLYWPKQVRVLGIPTPHQITEELTIQSEIAEFNQKLPSNIFDIDFSSAEIVWNNDLGAFIRQKGGFAPAKYIGPALNGPSLPGDAGGASSAGERRSPRAVARADGPAAVTPGASEAAGCGPADVTSIVAGQRTATWPYLTLPAAMAVLGILFALSWQRGRMKKQQAN